MQTMTSDYVIVGSGPGGATVARELARAGKEVVLLEKGKRHTLSKSKIKSYGIYDKYAVFSRSKEGVIIDRAVTLGGCSVVFSANSFDPPPWFEKAMGMDFSKAIGEIKEEIGIKPFSEAFTQNWEATNRLRQASQELGMNLKPQAKFINEELCRNYCDGCMTGCRRNAKWTARKWVDEATDLGCTVMVEADVRGVIVESGKAVGVEVKTPHKKFQIRANHVILAAGGIGSAVILQNSGVENAGKNFFMDPMNILWGMTKERVSKTTEMTFSCACEDFADSKGFILGNVSGKGAWVSHMMRPLASGRKIFHHYGKWDRMVGMFIKVADSNTGRVYANGTMSKPLTAEDRHRAEEATGLAASIMTKAGVIPDSIRVTTNIGGHPGGTAALGSVVDENLEVMGIENLFVCDTAVFPCSPGRPPTLMLLAMAKNFANKLIGQS